jgi:hypothetical protein
MAPVANAVRGCMKIEMRDSHIFVVGAALFVLMPAIQLFTL